jgi:hypothetical protein
MREMGSDERIYPPIHPGRVLKLLEAGGLEIAS